jgi:hypothetical protein
VGLLHIEGAAATEMREGWVGFNDRGGGGSLMLVVVACCETRGQEGLTGDRLDAIMQAQ